MGRFSDTSFERSRCLYSSLRCSKRQVPTSDKTEQYQLGFGESILDSFGTDVKNISSEIFDGHKIDRVNAVPWHFDHETNTNDHFFQWVSAWRNATPQRSIYEQNLPRDRWRCVDIPEDFAGIQRALQQPEVQRILADAQQRNYWLYVTGRTIFFFASSVTNALLQIRVQPDWRPWVAGRSLRTEVAAALKRVAMSGERAGVADTATRIPDTAARMRKLFGSIFELYRRDCQHIVCGLYRPPYDASLRHRQFNPLFVRGAFLRTLEASVETGARRARGRPGFLEVRAAVHRRAAAAQSGVVLLAEADPVGGAAAESDGMYNDNYLLGDVGRYPAYYLQNFHWQTDGWLSTRSARAYEYSTETLFSGSQARPSRPGPARPPHAHKHTHVHTWPKHHRCTEAHAVPWRRLREQDVRARSASSRAYIRATVRFRARD